jgi:hypothetical protein
MKKARRFASGFGNLVADCSLRRVADFGRSIFPIVGRRGNLCRALRDQPVDTSLVADVIEAVRETATVGHTDGPASVLMAIISEMGFQRPQPGMRSEASCSR